MLQTAQSIGRKQNSSSAIHEALNPTRGIRDEIARRGGVPKNHARENLKQLKELEKKVKQTQQQRELEQQAKLRIPSSSKFNHVPSRLYLATPSSSSASTRTGSSSSGVSQRSAKGALSTTSSTPLSNLSRASTTHASSAASLPRSPSSSSLSEPMPTLPERKTRMGELPKYLVQRKEHWSRIEQDRKQRELEEATWPPGTVPVPDEERVATLAYLQDAQKSLLSELARFPITLQPSQVQRYRRKQEIESKLKEIEKGIEVYSQTKVYMSKLAESAEV